MGEQLAIDADLANAARDQLAVLRAEVEHDDGVDRLAALSGLGQQMRGLVERVTGDRLTLGRVDQLGDGIGEGGFGRRQAAALRG